jgi:mRNA interferase MazF
MNEILRGDVWLFNPDPVKGKEIGKKNRPAIIISNNTFNNGPSNLLIIVPLTSKDRKIPCHVPIHPKDGGVKETSYAMCEQIRCISKERLISHWGPVRNPIVMRKIGDWLKGLLNLDEF